MTDPTGRSFLSYRRSRGNEAALLIAAQRDRGIPTWQDINNLDEKPLGPELRRVLQDQEVANAVLWITPDFPDSRVIQRTEAPEILDRKKQDDVFFVIPVMAGGWDYDKAKEAIDPMYGHEDLSLWGVRKVNGNPIDHAEAAEIARRVLHRRLAAIHKALPKDQPLKLEINTRQRLAWESGKALLMDWVERFDGRLAKPGSWEQHLLPALEDVARAIQQHAPGRAIEAGGILALPAAVALGACFLQPRGLKISWRQQMTQGREPQLWSIDRQREPSGFQAETRDHDHDGDDLAVLVAVNAGEKQIETAVQASRKDLPAFRAITRVTKAGNLPHDLATPGMALDVANIVVEAINEARADFRVIKCVHLFMAVPAGLAMMIGQLLNKVPLVQTYELVDDDGVSCYRKAALIRPCD